MSIIKESYLDVYICHCNPKNSVYSYLAKYNGNYLYYQEINYKDYNFRYFYLEKIFKVYKDYKNILLLQNIDNIDFHNLDDLLNLAQQFMLFQ